jgi:hypothetical protein
MPDSMRSVRPSLARRLVFSSQVNPECQGFLQLEQKSDEQVGQWTLWGRQRSMGPQTLHTVSHPARGHHVLFTSRSTSVETKKNKARLHILMTSCMKMAVFWDVMPYSWKWLMFQRCNTPKQSSLKKTSEVFKSIRNVVFRN